MRTGIVVSSLAAVAMGAAALGYALHPAEGAIGDALFLPVLIGSVLAPAALLWHHARSNGPDRLHEVYADLRSDSASPRVATADPGATATGLPRSAAASTSPTSRSAVGIPSSPLPRASAEVSRMLAPTLPSSLPPFTLAGLIGKDGLADILQFLEHGRRSGLLNVEKNGPIGLLGFSNGKITFAQTGTGSGAAAVREILAVDLGTFQFYENKRIGSSNCDLSATQVLLEWARETDEFSASRSGVA